MAIPVESIKSHFPIFSHRPELVYLDNAATTQKPRSVIDTITRFYEGENANIHRGLYDLSTDATRRFEAVRRQVAGFIGADDPNSIAFTKGTTESINLVAQGYLKKKLNPGDNVVISAMEHHANLIPWQQLCQEQKASLRIIPITPTGELALHELGALLDSRTRLVAITQISNVLGTINPVDEILSIAHQKNIPVLVDAAQGAGLYPIHVGRSKADFVAFSAHKMFGPLGTGVLYCAEPYHAALTPYQFGGGSISSVSFSSTQFLDYPRNQEAGTANIPGVLGLGSAIDFLEQLDLAAVAHHLKNLTLHFREGLQTLDGYSLVGNPTSSGAIVSFNSDKVHPHDIAGYLANENIAVRAGHHCCQPLHDSLGVPATVRVSFSVYNTMADVHKTLEALGAVKQFWS
jgi:cysteine desulfurase/selenocysteine lyase